MAKRLLFLCALGSSRALLAASILKALAAGEYDVWGNPPTNEDERLLAERVLHEQAISPLSLEHLIQPTFGMRWDEGIVLCSGATDM